MADPIVDLSLGKPIISPTLSPHLPGGERGQSRGLDGIPLMSIAHQTRAQRSQVGIDLLRRALHPSDLEQQRHQTRNQSIPQADLPMTHTRFRV